MLFSKPAVDFIIVGLGNPGSKYEWTRHNAGFLALDTIASLHSIPVNRLKWNALTGQGTIASHRVLLMKPQTYMNCSGEAVTAAMRFYKLPPQRVLCLFDDISLPPGRLRIRRSGSDGGQKGMRSIIQLSGSDQFPRIKLGVGAKPHPDYDLADWVLSTFTADERKVMQDTARRAADAAALILDDKLDEAMNVFNKG
ncbi:MAG: aminoacyl-tRNA hydrolase [Ruminococcaceae bacterium]|nr:aminoacyl-tRNA hydrolase [Oscillospiraceae bacterium]